MESSISNDYLDQYRAISMKIKKRFLKKPNLAEASEEFSKLTRNLADGEAWPQAGLCCVAVARCEQSLSNPAAEVSAIADAARYFMKAEVLNHGLMCPSYNEHLISAVSCYQTAIKLYVDQEKPTLAASLAMELSKSLSDLGKYSEALTFLETASSHLKNYPTDYVVCLTEKASCKVDLGDLEGALQIYTEILKLLSQYESSPSGYFSSISTNCEVCCLLLLLTLRPLPQQMKPEQTRFIEKYSSASDSKQIQTSYDDPELVVILQSLVLACHSNDSEIISALSPFLSPKLSGQPLHLFNILLNERGIPK